MNKSKIIFQTPIFINHPKREANFETLLHDAMKEMKTVVICVDDLTEKDVIDIFKPTSKEPRIYVAHKSNDGKGSNDEIFFTRYPIKTDDDLQKQVEAVTKKVQSPGYKPDKRQKVSEGKSDQNDQKEIEVDKI